MMETSGKKHKMSTTPEKCTEKPRAETVYDFLQHTKHYSPRQEFVDPLYFIEVMLIILNKLLICRVIPF